MKRGNERRVVVHVITTICRGGAENQLLVLARAQIELGFKVHILYLKGAPELKDSFLELGAKVNSVLTNRNFLSQILNLRRFLDNLSRSSIPVIHAHLPKAQLISASSKPRHLRLICTRHDADKFWPAGPGWISRNLLKFVNFKCSAWIAISEFVKAAMLSFGESYDRTEVKVVQYGFYQKKLKINPQKTNNLMNSLGINENNLVIGAIGRLVTHKDFPTLISAFSRVLQAGHEAILVIAGDGPLRQQLEYFGQTLGINEYIRWVGRVDDVDQYFALFDIFVLPSVSEGFGMVVLEAFNHKIPVIGSNTTAIAEVIGEFGGLTFDTGNPDSLFEKITEFLSPQSRIQFGLQGYSRLKNFNPDLMAKSISEIYFREEGRT